MMTPTRADAPRIRKLIEAIPPAALPEILVCVVKCCIQKKVFGERSVTMVVDTLEKQLKGQKIEQKS